MNSEVLLKAAGFLKNENRALWFSHEQRKSFTFQVLRDYGRDAAWLKSKLAETVPPSEFWFHMNFVPENSDICLDILVELGLRLTPIVKAAAR